MQLQIDQADSQLKPKLICMTPVRNEAWCLDVFLISTSIWADYIIIADHNSTDGSREIALKYPKVQLIDNTAKNYDENERQKLLIKEARKIEGPKILIALDADEILTANFNQTSDWQRILSSKPGEVFGLQWANVTPDKKHYFLSSFFYPWIFHDDGITEHKNYVRWIHSMRIPYPQNADAGYYQVKEFKVFHLAWIDKRRIESKSRFYQCLVCLKDSNEHFITLFRSYHQKKVKSRTIPPEWLENYRKSNFNIFEQLSLSRSMYWYDIEVKEQFKKYGISKFKYLDIWNKHWIDDLKNNLEITDPRNFYIKFIHAYLRASQNISSAILIRLVDKLLKKLF